jgi:hypothetical protein
MSSRLAACSAVSSRHARRDAPISQRACERRGRPPHRPHGSAAASASLEPVSFFLGKVIFGHRDRRAKWAREPKVLSRRDSTPVQNARKTRAIGAASGKSTAEISGGRRQIPCIGAFRRVDLVSMTVPSVGPVVAPSDAASCWRPGICNVPRAVVALDFEFVAAAGERPVPCARAACSASRTARPTNRDVRPCR